MRKFPFVTVDVFASRALEGNQLAVFTDARGLSEVEMQAIALETRLSETTFIIPREEATERADGVKVRIFTVAEEMPFAGHPTLGTASVIANARNLDAVALDLKVGKIPVTFTSTHDGRFGEMTQRDPEFARFMTQPRSRRPPTSRSLRLIPRCRFKPSRPVSRLRLCRCDRSRRSASWKSI